MRVMARGALDVYIPVDLGRKDSFFVMAVKTELFGLCNQEVTVSRPVRKMADLAPASAEGPVQPPFRNIQVVALKTKLLHRQQKSV